MCIDVEGQCEARLFLEDAYGDNSCAIFCQLEPGHGHGEPHQRLFEHGPGNWVLITWLRDERNTDFDPDWIDPDYVEDD